MRECQCEGVSVCQYGCKSCEWVVSVGRHTCTHSARVLQVGGLCREA